jgi:hypothetical protein
MIHLVAAIDSLLRLLSSQNADALTLATDKVPSLTRGGMQMPLSMPPIGAALMDTFVHELLAPDAIAGARETREIREHTVEHGEFAISVRAQDEGWTIAARRRPARPRRAPEPAPRPGPAPPASTPAASPAVSPAVEAATVDQARAQLDRWIQRALYDGASDLLLSPGGTRARVAGRLLELPGAPQHGRGPCGRERTVGVAASRRGPCATSSIPAGGDRQLPQAWRQSASITSAPTARAPLRTMHSRWQRSKGGTQLRCGR